MNDQKLVYLSRRRSEVLQLKESFKNENFELALSVGHRLKGHGESFGFPAISALGVNMEEAARERDMIKLQEIVKSLDNIVEENIRLIEK